MSVFFGWFFDVLMDKHQIEEDKKDADSPCGTTNENAGKEE